MYVAVERLSLLREDLLRTGRRFEKIQRASPAAFRDSPECTSKGVP
jgi:hypothetical protein